MTEERPPRVLVIGAEGEGRREIVDFLVARGHAVQEAAQEEQALSCVRDEPGGLVIVNLAPAPAAALEIIRKVILANSEQTVMAICDERREGQAAALKQGAFVVVGRPLHATDFEQALQAAMERVRLLSLNTFLRNETLQDDLTDAFNRRHLDRYVEEELERARRHQHPFSILFFDLDHLKKVNDQYGHLCGSQVLVGVVALVKEKLRLSDKIFRFGGDEFIVTLPETDREGAMRVAQRLRKAIKGNKFRVTDQAEAALTASFGIATYPGDGRTRDELLRHADEAMYLIKTTSRDGVGTKERL
ncbi:MAG: diguanylate cyclase [Candidatus Methylomirabilales bacterium]